MLYEDEEKNKKECLFSLSRMNRYYLLPFLVPLVAFPSNYLTKQIIKDNGKYNDAKDITEENNHTFAFLYQMSYGISLILGGLLYFITILRSKTEIKPNFGINLIIKKYTKKIEDNKYKEYLIILSMSIIMILYNSLRAYSAVYSTLDKRLYLLFFFTLINVFIFKKQIYKHQKFALIFTFNYWSNYYYY